MPPETDYEVGYKKPPKQSQFKKGQSGNPRGRPSGKKNVRTIFNDALNETVPIVENGRRRKIGKGEAMFKQLANRAAQGDLKATQIILRYLPALDRRNVPHRMLETSSLPKSGMIVHVPDNGRDPELTKVLLSAQSKAQEEYFARKQQERDRQNPANENRKKEVA